jgi:hypothetical protein
VDPPFKVDRQIVDHRQHGAAMFGLVVLQGQRPSRQRWQVVVGGSSNRMDHGFRILSRAGGAERDASDQLVSETWFSCGRVKRCFISSQA